MRAQKEKEIGEISDIITEKEEQIETMNKAIDNYNDKITR